MTGRQSLSARTVHHLQPARQAQVEDLGIYLAFSV